MHLITEHNGVMDKSVAKRLLMQMASEQPKAEERTVESAQNVPNGDLISRKMAIDALEKVARLFPYRVPGNRDTYDRYNEAWNDAIGRAEIEIEKLPSAQPERKTGRWIEENPQNSPDCRLIKCSECGDTYIVNMSIDYADWIEGRNFCRRCGADLRGGNNGKST